MAKTNSSRSYDVVVVGGGAAGLAASVIIAREAKDSVSLALLEKSPRTGRKLLATGNGTCNLSNLDADISQYNGCNRSFAEHVLGAFPPDKTCEFFKSVGLECTVRESRKIYPVCAHAAAVLDCLRLEAAALGVGEFCNTEVLNISSDNSGFKIETSAGEYHARFILICTGGMASPALGGSSDAYSPLLSLGHTRTPLFPSIVQVCTDTRYIKALKGIRVNALLSFLHDQKQIAKQKGEILFAEYGISGPAVMQISRFVGEWERRRTGTMTAIIDLLPDMDDKELSQSLKLRAGLRQRTLGDMLTGLLQKRLGQTVLRSLDYQLDRPVTSLNRSDLDKIKNKIRRFDAEIIGTRGMAGAQVTAGGISTDEFNPLTMQSNIIPNMYAAGEVLDIDGNCGGFNLQWAWASAYVASKSIVDKL